MKCTYLIQEAPGSLSTSIFARSVIIIFKVRTYLNGLKQYNILRFQFNLFRNTVSDLDSNCILCLCAAGWTFILCLFVFYEFRN